MSKDDYFGTWKNQKDLNYLTEELREYIYQKYLVKASVFQRDDFKCINIDCKQPESSLTLHHVKFKKNGGEDKVRNGVTLCQSCHRRYHKGTLALTFPDNESTPVNLRGRTYRVEKSKEIDWKQVKFEMKRLRKTLNEYKKYRIKYDEVLMLLKFLEVNFDTEDD